jgi:hypothetical protein
MNAMKETILRLPIPTLAQEVHEFLGTAGYCRLWILGYAELAKPLYEATKDKAPWPGVQINKRPLRSLRPPS